MWSVGEDELDMVKEKEARYNQLKELIDKQEAEMKKIFAEINSLATKLR